MREEPIDKFLRPIRRIFENESAVGIILIIMVVIAMTWANSPWQHSYHALWEKHLVIGVENFKVDKSIHHWINDGLMAMFFFIIGLEIKREVISGDLSSWKKASLPIAAAVGGMVIPAAVYLAFNYSGSGESGWGIPMATDIAFTLGLIALVSSRVPLSLKVFLTALATVDDIGAVLVIAIFYTPDIQYINLVYAALFLGLMFGGNLVGIRNRWFYFIVGAFGLWTAILYSGIHATLAGVLGALAIPGKVKLEREGFKEKLSNWNLSYENITKREGPFISEDKLTLMLKMENGIRNAMTPSQYLEAKLEPIVSYLVIPIFALANAGVTLKGDISLLTHPVPLGIILGLLVGKIFGITVFSQVMIKSGLSEQPKQSNLKSIGGVSLMAGIGFTMSLFLADLAFEDQQLIDYAKVGILIASFLASAIGLLWFRFVVKKPEEDS